MVVGYAQPAMAAVGVGRPANMMSFMDSLKKCFGLYANFSGRASRSEYWWFALFSFFVDMFTSVIDAAVFGVPMGMTGWVNFGATLAIFLPSLAVAVRRIHDHDKSGWFILIPFYNIYLLIIEGEPMANRFGDVPTNTL